MKIHTQNLNELKGEIVGSMFWHGRAWLKTRKRFEEILHAEWLFGKHAREWGLTARFGAGDSDAGLTLHACVPFVFSIYLCFENVYRCEECQLGISAHNGGIWLHTFNGRNSSSSDDPWYKQSHCWYYPWSLEHHQTEILEHKANLPMLAKAVWKERDENGKYKRFLEGYCEREMAEKSVSETYDYTYTLKSGAVQKRKATVFVDRMTWRARWWPFIPRQKVATCISIRFSDEVGEGTGSWKGGCTGCGYEMKPGETPQETLRRMEKERTFKR